MFVPQSAVRLYKQTKEQTVQCFVLNRLPFTCRLSQLCSSKCIYIPKAMMETTYKDTIKVLVLSISIFTIKITVYY